MILMSLTLFLFFSLFLLPSLDNGTSAKRIKVLPSSSELTSQNQATTSQKQDKVKVAAVKPRPQIEDEFKPIPLDKLSEYIQTHRSGYNCGDEDDEEEEEASGFTKEFHVS